EPEILESQECCARSPFIDARIEIGYSWGQFIGIKEDYAELGLFLPAVFCDQWAIFVDGRGYRFENDQWGASAGVGVRRFICDGNILGVNFYYDYLEGENRGFFDRFGVGFEWLGPCFDLRVNGYYPVGGHESIVSNTFTCTYPGTAFVYTRSRVDFSISKGFDAEIGMPLFCKCHFRLYGAVGPYYYDRKNHEGFWGGYARLDLSIWDYFWVRVRSSYDEVYHSRTQVTLLLSLPLDFLCNWRCCRDYCRDLLTQPVRRNGIIFTDQPCTQRTWNW
ncbi:hypothetical protein AYO37_01325, partial [Opitutia bacterium SCGC AG-212-L18]